MANKWIFAVGAVLAAGALLWIGNLSAPDAGPDTPETAAAENRGPTSPPRPSLADIALEPMDFRRNAALYELLVAADTPRIRALLAEVSTLPASLHRYDISRVIYLRFVSLDPAAAANHLLDGIAKPSWVRAVYRAWAHTDYAAAVAHAATLGPLARQTAAQAIFELDVPDAQRRAVAKAMQSPRALASAVLWEGRLFERRDLAEAWQRADEIPRESWKERRRLLRATVEAWAREDPYAAMAAVEGLDPITSEFIMPHALRAWAEADPYGALDWLLVREPHRRPAEWVAAAMESLTKHAPDQAVDALASMPDPMRSHALSATLTALAAVEPREAIALFDSLAAHERAGVAMWLFAAKLTENAPDEALSWLLRLPEESQANALPSVAHMAFFGDHALLLRRIGAIENPTLQHRVARQIAVLEAERDPLAAWRWANSLAPVASGSAVGAVFSRWYDMAPEAALDALRAAPPPGDAHNRVLEEALLRRVESAPAQAEALFDEMDSSPARVRAAQSLVDYFTNINPNPKRAARYRGFIDDAAKAEEDEGDDED